MFKYFTLGLLLLVFSAVANAQNPQVVFETNKGQFVVELFPEKAPNTVKNFLGYVNSGFYNNTIFHRVIKQFMVQGGGFNQAMVKKETKAPIKNEADNGLRNETGTIAMARTSAPHSATAQFFINTNHNQFLDFRSPDPQNYGYCVFGRVVKGMDIVFNIDDSQTHHKNGHADVPVNPIIIQSIHLN